jgi:hypothetical protein
VTELHWQRLFAAQKESGRVIMRLARESSIG